MDLIIFTVMKLNHKYDKSNCGWFSLNGFPVLSHLSSNCGKLRVTCQIIYIHLLLNSTKFYSDPLNEE